jgi:septal ring factor EnvC (AmiA/AmiB activator)
VTFYAILCFYTAQEAAMPNEDVLRMRIPAELRASLGKEASTNRRSVGAEAIYRLERSFDLARLIDLQLEPKLRPLEQELRNVRLVLGTTGETLLAMEKKLDAMQHALVEMQRVKRRGS